MFKKAKYRWQIKSSSRSNQLTGVEADIEVEQYTGVEAMAALDPELHLEQNPEHQPERDDSETAHALLPEQTEHNVVELARKRGGDHLGTDHTDGPKVKMLCRGQRRDSQEKEFTSGTYDTSSPKSMQSESCGEVIDRFQDITSNPDEMKNVMETDQIISEQYIIKASAKHWGEERQQSQTTQDNMRVNDSDISAETCIVCTDIGNGVTHSQDDDGNGGFTCKHVVGETQSSHTISTYCRDPCVHSNEAQLEILSSDSTEDKHESLDHTLSPALSIDSQCDVPNSEVVSHSQSDGCPFTAIKSKTLALSEGLCDETEGNQSDISPSGTPDTSPGSQERLERLSEMMDPECMPPPTYRPPSTTPRRLTYLERWRCQHLAKAMVDNAINKTLEESGLSPNPDPELIGDATRRTNVETEGVSHAIRMVGLRPRYSPSSMQRLNPIINRLTQVSENIFSANLRLRERNSGNAQAQSEVGVSSPTPPLVSQHRREESSQPPANYTRRTGQVMYHFGRERSESAKAEVRQTNPCEHGGLGHGAFTNCKQCVNNYPHPYPPRLPPIHFDSVDPIVETIVEPNVIPFQVDGRQTQSAKQESVNYSNNAILVDNRRKCDTDMPDEPIKDLPDEPMTDFQGEPMKDLPDEPVKDSLGEPMTDSSCEDDEKNHTFPRVEGAVNDPQENLSTSFILDTAVAFAINEKGLQLG